jgi:hypothetical protein
MQFLQPTGKKPRQPLDVNGQIVLENWMEAMGCWYSLRGVLI